MKLDRSYKLESKTLDIYRDLKFEPIFRSLDMSVQLHTILRIDSALKKLKEMGQNEKYQLINSEFVYNNLSKRGMRRNRRILEFCDDIEKEYTRFQFNDPESRAELLKMFSRG